MGHCVEDRGCQWRCLLVHQGPNDRVRLGGELPCSDRVRVINDNMLDIPDTRTLGPPRLTLLTYNKHPPTPGKKRTLLQILFATETVRYSTSTEEWVRASSQRGPTVPIFIAGRR